MAPSGNAPRDGEVLRGPRDPTWACGCGRDENWASRTKCRGCGRSAPQSTLAKAKTADKAARERDRKGDADAGGSKGGREDGKGGAKTGKDRVDPKKLLEDERRKHAAETRKLKEELELARKGGAAPMAVDAEEGEDDDLGKAVATARERLRKAKAAPEELHDLLQGGYEACVAKLQGELSAAQAARRASNPLSKQLEGAEAYKSRMDKKLTEAKAELDERDKELLEAGKRRDQQKEAVAEAEAASAKAAEEVANLAKQLAADRATSPPGAGGSSPAAAVPPSGCVTVAYAEEKWQEREAAFAKQLEQLKADLGAAPANVAASGAASVASDLGNPDDLDDEQWSKVEKGRRSALLRRQKDELASKLRTRLNGVASVRSPFRK
jgi:DNA repair exonuclease SbcCD ATPase subunit